MEKYLPIVKKHIEESFDMNEITLEECPMFPAGVRVIDRNGGECIFFYDVFKQTVEVMFS